MSTKTVDVDTCYYRDGFTALQKVQSHIQYSIVLGRDSNKTSVKILADMVHGYVPNSTENIKETPRGGKIIHEEIRDAEWLHSKSTWQMISIILGALPDIFD